MSSGMAGRTERDTVRRVVPKVGAFGPRFDVVRVEIPAALPAVLARPAVAVHHGGTERLVGGILEVGCPRGSVSAFPVRMRLADQMLVTGRNASCELDPRADRVPMFDGERSAGESTADVLALTVGNDAAGCRWLSLSSGADLCLGALRLRRVRREVAPRCRAGVRAEAQSSRRVFGSTLLARSNGRHKAKITGDAGCF